MIERHLPTLTRNLNKKKLANNYDVAVNIILYLRELLRGLSFSFPIAISTIFMIALYSFSSTTP